MPLSKQLKNQHLLWRAGFGPSSEMLNDLSEYSPIQVYKALQKASTKKPAFIDVSSNYLKGLFMGVQELGNQKRSKMDEDEKKKYQKELRDNVRNLNQVWMAEMVNSKAQLREKMAFFWHGHFACRNLNVFYQQGLLDIIRTNALGSFKELLMEVSKSAAMLNFLNNNQNKKDQPNENFAREVMELFTMGRGNYGEKDIKEAARAFTGWGANIKGEFQFRRFQHDAGSKTILGKTKNFSGEDVIELLLEQKQTARFITNKVYRFFVNEKIDPTKSEWLAERFYQSNYDISKLMEDIFTSDWFYDEKNIGSKIKSPVELLVGLQRMLPAKIENEEALPLLQRVLGQMLFYPPNVAGWPSGNAWIDSSSLMFRMRVPQLLNASDELNFQAKDDDDQTMGRKKETMDMQSAGFNRRQIIKATISWEMYINNFKNTARENLIEGISKLVLQTNTGFNKEFIAGFSNSSSRENFIKTATIQIMSTPEYQLC